MKTISSIEETPIGEKSQAINNKVIGMQAFLDDDVRMPKPGNLNKQESGSYSQSLTARTYAFNDEDKCRIIELIDETPPKKKVIKRIKKAETRINTAIQG